MSIRYEATKDAVKIWFGETDQPNILQDTWPNGTAWANKAEAESWALAFIESLENPESLLAGDSPEKPLKARQVPPVFEESIIEETATSDLAE